MSTGEPGRLRAAHKEAQGTEPVESLDLFYKGLRVASAVVIASLISNNASLTELNLYHNEVEDEGVTAICEAVQSNKETKLASLNVGSNKIGPAGAKSVAAMVAVIPSLTGSTCMATRSRMRASP